VDRLQKAVYEAAATLAIVLTVVAAIAVYVINTLVPLRYS